MANADAARGAVIRNSNSGGEGRTQVMHASASETIAKGDVVALTGSADSTGQYPAITKVTTSLVPVGIVVGFVPNKDRPSGQKYKASGDTDYVIVNIDPQVEFVMQCNGTLAAADIGLHADLSDAGVDTLTGASGYEVDLSSKNASADLHVIIKGLDKRPDNALGADADVICGFSQHEYAGKGQAGVA